MKISAIVTVGALIACGLAAAPADDDREGESRLTTARTAEPLLAAHNRERAAEKLPPLEIDPKLNAAAQAHADDMARHGEMSHEGSDGSSPFVRIARKGYHYLTCGENVATGQVSVQEVMKSWMESPPHRANIMGKYTQAGLAVALDDKGQSYWCVNFGTPWPKLDPDAAAKDVLTLLNQERTTAGLKPLTRDARLAAAATRIAEATARADSFESSPDIETEVKKSGYPYRQLVELAASGQPNPTDLVHSWLEKETDRKQVLGEFTELGVGYARTAADKPYWCLFLARPLEP
jgi:uncharacterized protein YkwD